MEVKGLSTSQAGGGYHRQRNGPRARVVFRRKTRRPWHSSGLFTFLVNCSSQANLWLKSGHLWWRKVLLCFPQHLLASYLCKCSVEVREAHSLRIGWKVKLPKGWGWRWQEPEQRVGARTKTDLRRGWNSGTRVSRNSCNWLLSLKPVTPQASGSPAFWSQDPFTLLKIIAEAKELVFM